MEGNLKDNPKKKLKCVGYHVMCEPEVSKSSINVCQRSSSSSCSKKTAIKPMRADYLITISAFSNRLQIQAQSPRHVVMYTFFASEYCAQSSVCDQTNKNTHIVAI